MSEAIARTGSDQAMGCYVHLPFCDRICPYCDFAVVAYERIKAERYVAALEAEIARAESPALPVQSIFLGGGTPSALAADHVARVLSALFAKFDIEVGSVECTLEANPSRNIADLPLWRSAGVTRLSVGVQAFDDDELQRLGRDHTAAEAIEFVRAARRAGYDDLSIDLIAGVPGQTLASFSSGLDRAVDLSPDHISVYGLTVEPSTPYARWQAREPAAFPDDDAVADMLVRAHDTLTAVGYGHYEISNFARPSRECRHNLGYWRQRDCIAIGMSAAGYEGGTRYRNVRDFSAYCGAVEQSRSPRDEVERLDFGARLGEAAMLALRTEVGIDREDFRRRFGVDIDTVFADALKKCSAAGLLEADSRGARLTDRGRLLANAVCAEFLQPRLTEVR
jgi:oxygen-independent coproporphyrinogen-3 oxidase